MRVYVSGLDGYLAPILIKRLEEQYKNDEETEEKQEVVEFVGSVSGEDSKPCVKNSEFAVRNDLTRIAELACGADVIVLNLHESLKEASSILRAIKTADGKKSLILISTLLTWGKTPLNVQSNEEGKEEDTEQPVMFLEEEFNRRKPSNEYLLHKTLEAQTLALAHDSLSTTVVAAGFLYGAGENIFHDIFRNAWMNKPCAIPSECKNSIPTLHINDLASAICTIISEPPTQQYIVAADQAHSTLHDIVVAAYSVFQPAAASVVAVTELPSEEESSETEPVWKNFQCTPKILDEDESAELLVKEPNWSTLNVDLRFDVSSSSIQSLVTEWTSEQGLVENIEKVVEEFKTSRDLRPIKGVILGAPSSGKSTLSQSLCDEYTLPCITVESATAYILENLENERSERARKLEDYEAAKQRARLESKSDEEEDQNEGKEAVEEEEEEDQSEEKLAIMEKSLLEKLGEKVETSLEKDENLPQFLLAKVIRAKMLSSECLNQGYILDGVAESLSQLKQIYKISSCEIPEEEEETPADDESKEEEEEFILDTRIVPSSVLFLDADDDILRSRALNDGKDEGTFESILAEFRKNNDDSNLQTPLSFFEVVCKLESLYVPFSSEESKSDDTRDNIRMYLEKGGKPFNYHPTPEEVSEREALARVQKLAQEEEERAKRIAEEEERKAEEAKYAEEMETFREKTRSHEKELLDARSEPLRQYLLENVMPALSKGLVETCRAKPDDPIDFLAEYLFSYQEGESKSE